MKHRNCINLNYRNNRELEAMLRLGIHHGDIEREFEFVDRFSAREREYTCGRCPSDGLCRYVNKYGVVR